MGKRYYCDYCDKSFADNPVNRKLHLSGQIHLRNKKVHYDAVKDEREILQDDVHKKPCRSFITTGDCRFGERCQYSHLTNDDKARLSRKIVQKQKRASEQEKKRKQTISDLSCVLDKWVKEWSIQKATKQDATKSDGEFERKEQETRHIIPAYQVAECLKVFPSLPLSLIPPTNEDILNAEYVDWG